MKIAFLCGELEPGKNGVGDYTRCLAQECVRLGHEAIMIALHDRAVNVPTITPTADRDICIPELRLPSRLSWEEKTAAAAGYLASHTPDRVSLQFVPYAFHPKGIIGELGRYLRPLMAGRKSHLMLHELWIGAERGASLKEKAVGLMQRSGIEKMVRCLQPEEIHTSNEAYRARLARRGVNAEVLPLFGNIPVQEANADDWLFPLLRDAGVDISPNNRHRFWLFGLFGAMHSIWPTEPLFGILREAAERGGKRIVILSAGSMGGGESVYDAAAARYGPDMAFLRLGRQPAGRISAYLNSLDAGLSASPLILTGKSGTVVSMLEHGLPVIVNRDDVHYPGIALPPDQEPLLHRVDAHLSAKLAANLPKQPAKPRLRAVAQQFSMSL